MELIIVLKLEIKMMDSSNRGTGVEKELLELSNKLETIRNVLEDAEKRGVNDQRIKCWLKKLEATTYEMDDILDEWNYSLLKHKTEIRHAAPSSHLHVYVSIIFVTSLPAINLTPTPWREQSTHLIGLKKVHGVDIYRKKNQVVSKLMLRDADSQILELLTAWEQKLEAFVLGKKFLLVLDDVWTEDESKWKDLKICLQCGAAEKSEEECGKFEYFGKKIANKCKGLPLVGIVLGRLLRFKDLEGWKDVENNYRIHAATLKEEWITLGYLCSISGSGDVELKGTDCLNDLAMRSLFQDVEIKIPRDIGNLVQLRKLDLSRNRELKELPDSICKLVELRTLSIANCSLEEIPPEIGKLVQLRQLDLSLNRKIQELPESICSLVELQIMKIAGTTINCLPEALGCWRRTIKDIPSKLEELKICFMSRMNEIEALIPRLKLKQLTIVGYGGSRLPHWMSSSLNFIKQIDLCYLSEVSSLPAMGKLPLLESMHILLLVGHEFLGIESSSDDVVAFPKLNKQYFNGCEKWEDITEEEEESTAISIMPYLTELTIYGCVSLKKLPHRLLHKASSSLRWLYIYDSTELIKTYGEDKEDINELLLKLKSAAVDCKRGPSRSQQLIRLSTQKLNLVARLTQMQDKLPHSSDWIQTAVDPHQFRTSQHFNEYNLQTRNFVEEDYEGVTHKGGVNGGKNQNKRKRVVDKKPDIIKGQWNPEEDGRLAVYSDNKEVILFYSLNDVKVSQRKRLRTAAELMELKKLANGGGFKDDNLVVKQPNEIEASTTRASICLLLI
ncbi:hypothetical protein SASPL_123609 [Salvia splendens]|uniref:Disease resistance protein RPM1 n=1 Tax=Salvia splendens TaxID=180675 RepID=A0A8X8XLR1_SALSN|nr:hypothetical protein SASPL_123609 [Salvia splendens]